MCARSSCKFGRKLVQKLVQAEAMTDLRAEMQALLTRAADHEARRQAARDRGDELAIRQHEDELRRLWARYVALDHSSDNRQPMEAIR